MEPLQVGALIASMEAIVKKLSRLSWQYYQLAGVAAGKTGDCFPGFWGASAGTALDADPCLCRALHHCFQETTVCNEPSKPLLPQILLIINASRNCLS